MIVHKRIRVVSGEVEEAPLQYSGAYSKAQGWTDIRVAEFPPKAIVDSLVILEAGGTVPSIGKKHAIQHPGAWLYLNGPFFDRDSKKVIGKTIINGKVVIGDVPATVKRPHLYCLDNGKIDIGRVVDPTGIRWAVCGYTLVRDGKYVFPVPEEQIKPDVADGYNQRTLWGIKDDGAHIPVVIDEGPKDKGATQKEAALFLISLGCKKVIGLDGGGSSTFYSNDADICDALELRNGYHVAEVGSSPRVVHHAITLKLDKSVLFPKPMKGVDSAQPLTAEKIKALAADGVQFIVRYLTVDKYAWKRLTRAEVESICAAGMNIGSVWETTAGRAALGALAGKEDGALALQEAAKVWQPVGSVIFFAVDYDAQSKDFDAIESYLRAAAVAMAGTYQVGVYGSYMVIEEMAARGACEWFWQTYAWSRGQKSSKAHIYQYKNDTKLAGLSVDLNEAYTDEVFWTPAVSQSPQADTTTAKPLPTISRTVAGLLNGRSVSDGYLIEGKTYVPLRELSEALGAEVGWDPERFEYELKGGK